MNAPKSVVNARAPGWGHQSPSLELDGTGAVLYRYVYATMGHSPDYVVNGAGATYRVVRDQLGSPLLIVNITNPSDVLLDARYSAFGTRSATTVAASAPTLGYAGGIYDEDTGLVRFGARDYDALVGRWTSKDPILWDGGQGNLYVYVGGDPVNHLDPVGLLDLFAFAAYELAGRVAFVHGGLEYVTLAGYNTDSGTYTADIFAGGAASAAKQTTSNITMVGRYPSTDGSRSTYLILGWGAKCHLLRVLGWALERTTLTTITAFICLRVVACSASMARLASAFLRRVG